MHKQSGRQYKSMHSFGISDTPKEKQTQKKQNKKKVCVLYNTL